MAKNTYDYGNAIKKLICGESYIDCSVDIDEYENGLPKRGVDTCIQFNVINMVIFYFYAKYLPTYSKDEILYQLYSVNDGIDGVYHLFLDLIETDDHEEEICKYFEEEISKIK